MSTTQQHLQISDIKDNIVWLKDGGAALILQVSAVNFGLLSDREQIAIISSFAQMLNSLSFSIQIVIHSERLNISSYLAILDKAQKAQTNQLLSKMMSYYRQFIQTTIKENEVLDKRCYIVVPLYRLELGLTSSQESILEKVKTVLIPRRNQIIRQLNRVGLKAEQASSQQLIELFFDIYNGQQIPTPASQPINPSEIAVKLKNPQVNTPATTFASQNNTSQAPAQNPAMAPQQQSRNHPFVVEELT